jgi:hypothetical protein
MVNNDCPMKACILLAVWLLVGFGQAAAAPQKGKHRGAAGPGKLEVEFLPLLEDDGTESLVNGKPVVNYVPDGVTVDKNGGLEVRTDLLLRTRPWVRNRYLGRLVSINGDITFLPSARIVTDKRGRFRVTLKTILNDQKAWAIRIRLTKGQKFDIEWD